MEEADAMRNYRNVERAFDDIDSKKYLLPHHYLFSLITMTS